MSRSKYVVLLLMLCLASPAWGQSAEDLARIEKQMQEQKAAAARLEKKEQATSEELDKLREKLIAATTATQDKQNEKEDLEDKLTKLEKETLLRSKALDASRQRLAELTGGLLQLSREPPAFFALRESSAADQVHRAVLLRSLLPKLKEETNSIVRELDNYEKLQTQTQAQRKLVVAAQQNLQWQRHNLDQLVRTRQGLLEKTQTEKDAIAQQLTALTNEAKDLRQLMEKVSQPGWGKNVLKAPAGRAPALHAGLKSPIAGKLIRAYGARDDFGVASDGVTYTAAPASPIVAPQSGRVVFAGPFKGYGHVVILQHAGGAHSFLAGFGRIDADMGQSVGAGEPLGILGGVGEGKGELYFEWRVHGEPKDPSTQGLDTKVKAPKS